MFAKTELKANPLYADLVKTTGEAPKWNFHKYLVDRKGARVQSFGTKIEPNDAKLVGAIERLLEDAQ
jgi:glutathione peroxidase